MTFIVGMRCSDGIVILADTLESGGVVKRYRQKVHAENVIAGWGVAWGVAGNAHVADKFSQKLRELLGHDFYECHKTELVVERCLKWIRQQYSGPDEDIDVILGMFGTSRRDPRSRGVSTPTPEQYLYRADSLTGCLAPVKDYYTAGMDVTLATFILENMRNPFGYIDEAIRLGVFATAVMKKYATGVGGDTNGFVYRLGIDGWAPVLERDILEIELSFPVVALERCASEFWMNHPKARNNAEMLSSQLRITKSLGRRGSKQSASRKSKLKQ